WSAQMVESPVAARRLPVPGSPVEVLAPHPVITSAYADASQKRTFLNAIFDQTAGDYDRVERWLSLGTGTWYRRTALARAGLKRGMSVVDVATGTGLVAEGALRLIGPIPPARLVGVDPSAEMMRRARERLGIQTEAATAEALPFADSSFDFLSMGYALRHVEDVGGAFREFHRVLAPGGRVCILEITRPRTRLGRALLRVYLGTLSRTVGLFGRLAPRTPELWAYYWETIDKCLPPQEVLHALSSAGFVQVERRVFGGIFSEYTCVKAGR
ncbi:MAG TPA: class I SAM-dependent methyltransferase, partial [Phycisphaerales bacterium]|nr:class I SAM-dependent methyltransferase [Phycisphaerales bacterium]